MLRTLALALLIVAPVLPVEAADVDPLNSLYTGKICGIQYRSSNIQISQPTAFPSIQGGFKACTTNELILGGGCKLLQIPELGQRFPIVESHSGPNDTGNMVRYNCSVKITETLQTSTWLVPIAVCGVKCP